MSLIILSPILFPCAASFSNIKLKVELSGVPLSQCNQVYRSQNVVLSQKQLCAGGQPGKDSCRGMKNYSQIEIGSVKPFTFCIVLSTLFQ